MEQFGRVLNYIQMRSSEQLLNSPTPPAPDHAALGKSRVAMKSNFPLTRRRAKAPLGRGREESEAFLDSKKNEAMRNFETGLQLQPTSRSKRVMLSCFCERRKGNILKDKNARDDNGNGF